MDRKEITIIVGAGISGLVLALLLAKQGRKIFIYDKRTIFDNEAEGRSINFTISGRGLTVLAQLGLKESVIAHSAILNGRVLHLQNSKSVHYQYGTQKSQVLYSIRRSMLIDILLSAARLEKNICLYLGFELIHIDESTMICDFWDVINKKTVIKKAECVIGADGAFSTVRSFMLKKQMSSYSQTVFNWAYKEYQFDYEDAKKLNLTTDRMHMWPKSNALLVAIPNNDKTFSVILTAPIQSKNGKLNNFDELVKQEYQHIVNTTQSFFKKCGQEACYYLVSIKVNKWHLHDKIILIGDACHATYPFYGQGMNSALEDAVVLSNFLSDKSLSRLEAFVGYENIRRSDTNALHQLSEAHLHNMTKAMISSFGRIGNAIDYYLAKWLRGKWIYEYEMVAQSTVSYSSILHAIKKQSYKKRMVIFFLIGLLLSFTLFINNTI